MDQVECILVTQDKSGKDEKFSKSELKNSMWQLKPHGDLNPITIRSYELYSHSYTFLWSIIVVGRVSASGATIRAAVEIVLTHNRDTVLFMSTLMEF